jgi:hypothetical protein
MTLLEFNDLESAILVHQDFTRQYTPIEKVALAALADYAGLG